MQHDHLDIGGSNSADPLSLIQVRGAEPGEFLFGFATKMRKRLVIKVVGDSLLSQPLMSIDRGLLPFHVARIFDVVGDLLGYFFVDVAQFRTLGNEIGPLSFWSS